MVTAMKDQKKEGKFTIPCTHPKQWPHHYYPLQSFFGEPSTLKLKKIQKMMSKCWTVEAHTYDYKTHNLKKNLTK